MATYAKFEGSKCFSSANQRAKAKLQNKRKLVGLSKTQERRTNRWEEDLTRTAGSMSYDAITN